MTLKFYDDGTGNSYTAMGVPGQLTSSNVTSNSADLTLPSAVTGAKYYELSESTDGGSSWIVVDSAIAPSSIVSPAAYSRTGLTSGATYQWRLRAKFASLISPVYSAVRSVMTAASSGNLPTFYLSSTASSLTANILNAAGYSSFQIRASADAGGTWGNWQSGLTLSGLTSGDGYDIQVQGVGGTPSISVSGYTWDGVASAPTATPGFRSSMSSTGALLTVTSPNGAASYQSRYSENGGTTWSTPVDGNIITGLTAGVSRIFQMRGINSSGSSAWGGGVTNDGVLAVPNSGLSGVLFADSFATGDLTHTANGAGWTNGNGRANVDVTNVISHSGTNCARFTFNATTDHDISQLGFDLGDNYKEIWISFYLYLPDGTEGIGPKWTHRKNPNTGHTSNNKFIRLWSNQRYQIAQMKNGASLEYSTQNPGDDNLLMEKLARMYDSTNKTTNWYEGAFGQSETVSFIDAAVLGTWHKIDLHFLADTPGNNGSGLTELYRDGVLVDSYQNLNDNNNNPFCAKYRQGYLLGAANSGFDVTTYAYMDDVKFSTVSTL